VNFKTTLYSLFLIFMGFTLEHLPLPSFLDWFQPAWVMLTVITLVFFAPHVFGFWLAIPVGLLLDVEHGTLLGLHIILVAVLILLVQLFYRRMYMFNVLQQALVLFLLIVVTEILSYWSMTIISNDVRPVMIWTPALTSAVMWPWVYVVGYRTLLFLQRN
jgi:rod shape-determining protein MreD